MHLCSQNYCALIFDLVLSCLAGRHVAQAQLMHSCLAVVKTSMLVVQRSQEPITSALLSASNQCDLQQAFSALLKCYTSILTDGMLKTTVLEMHRFLWF